MENNKIKSICCKANILEYPEYNLRVCPSCKSKVVINTKNKEDIKLFNGV